MPKYNKPKCPNFDTVTNEALENIGIDPTPENRTRVFYTICIIIRVLLAGIVLHFKDNRYLPYILLIISLFTSYRLYNNLYGKWWWKRSYHLIISLALSITCLLIIFKIIKQTEYMAYILYLDVFIGVIQSIGVKRC